MPRRSARRRAARRLGLLLAAVAVAVAAAWWLREPVVAEVRHVSGIHRVESHAALLRRVGNEARLDPDLLAAIMFAESSGRVDAESPVGAMGLFQLMLPTAVERAKLLRLPEPTREALLSDPELNARLGAHYLKWLERRYDGHLEKMLIAYNAGPGRLGRWIREAGSYEAWRAEREAAGNSDVLRYAAKVQRYRDIFRERGVVAPPHDHPPAPPQPPPSESAPNLVGPPQPSLPGAND